MGAVVVSAVLRAQAAAQGGDAAAADALTQAESTGRTEGLLAFLGREAEQSPASRDEDLVQMHRELAAIADLAGDWRAALASYEQVLLRRPRDADSLTRAGDLLMGAGGRTAEARAMFERARDAAATPEEQFWALLGLGRVAERIQTLADANRSYTLAFQIASRMSERAPSDSTWKRNLSVALGKIGALQAEQGLGDEAVESLKASLAIRAELAAAEPEDTTHMRDLSIGHAALGRVLTERGDLSGALESLEASRVIRERLVELDGANAPAKRELASVLQDLGHVRENGGEFAAALAWYRQAAGMLSELRTIDPDNLDWARDLSIAHNNIADVLLLMGDAAQSLASAAEAMAIARMLVARDEGNTQWQRDLAMCHYRIGDARMSLEEIPGALESFGAGLAIVERLATGDAANMSWKRDVYVGRGRVGDAKSRQDLPSAVVSYRSALEVAEAMSAADPGNPEYQRDRATSLRKIGLALGALADFEDALRSTEAERAIRVSMLERDRANVKWKRDLGLCEHTLGLILIDLGRLDEARVHAREAARILAEVSAAAPDSAEWRADAADAAAVLERLGTG